MHSFCQQRFVEYVLWERDNQQLSSVLPGLRRTQRLWDPDLLQCGRKKGAEVVKTSTTPKATCVKWMTCLVILNSEMYFGVMERVGTTVWGKSEHTETAQSTLEFMSCLPYTVTTALQNSRRAGRPFQPIIVIKEYQKAMWLDSGKW